MWLHYPCFVVDILLTFQSLGSWQLMIRPELPDTQSPTLEMPAAKDIAKRPTQERLWQSIKITSIYAWQNGWSGGKGACTSQWTSQQQAQLMSPGQSLNTASAAQQLQRWLYVAHLLAITAVWGASGMNADACASLCDPSKQLQSNFSSFLSLAALANLAEPEILSGTGPPTAPLLMPGGQIPCMCTL